MEFDLREHGFKTDLEYGQLDISGNAQFGFRPYQLMVASIASCSGSVFRKILDKQRIQIEDMRIKANIVRNEDEANRIEKITLLFTIKGHQLDEGKLSKSLKIARKNCSMIRSVENSIQIEEKIEVME
jgi:putative redox protein